MVTITVNAVEEVPVAERASGRLGWSLTGSVFVLTIAVMLVAQAHAVSVVQQCTHNPDIGISGRISAAAVLCSAPFIAVAVAAAQFTIHRWLPARPGIRWTVAAAVVVAAWLGCYVMVVHSGVAGLPTTCRA
jgi:NADH:ubiquinone oxidoreductase subunit 4 (subunit M)